MNTKSFIIWKILKFKSNNVINLHIYQIIRLFINIRITKIYTGPKLSDLNKNILKIIKLLKIRFINFDFIQFLSITIYVYLFQL